MVGTKYILLYLQDAFAGQAAFDKPARKDFEIL
jgi:hypothetical protein